MGLAYSNRSPVAGRQEEEDKNGLRIGAVREAHEEDSGLRGCNLVGHSITLRLGLMCFYSERNFVIIPSYFLDAVSVYLSVFFLSYMCFF